MEVKLFGHCLIVMKNSVLLFYLNDVCCSFYEFLNRVSRVREGKDKFQRCDNRGPLSINGAGSV